MLVRPHISIGPVSPCKVGLDLTSKAEIDVFCVLCEFDLLKFLKIFHFWVFFHFKN